MHPGFPSSLPLGEILEGTFTWRINISPSLITDLSSLATSTLIQPHFNVEENQEFDLQRFIHSIYAN